MGRTGARPDFLWASSFFLFAALLLFSLIRSVTGGMDLLVNRYDILPWIFVVSLVLLFPSMVLVAYGRFDWFHPLVYPVWSYLFPAFAIGSLYIASAAYDSRSLSLLPDPDRDIPLAMMCVAVGFAGLFAGFAVPAARAAGMRVANVLPAWEWSGTGMLVACFILHILGRIIEYFAFSRGAIGYQVGESPALLGNTFYSFSLFGRMTMFLLWLELFRLRRFRAGHYLVLAILLMLIPYSVMISGGKGELLRSVITVFFAFWASGRRIRPRHSFTAVVLVLIALLAGMIYGTSFRRIKGGEDMVGFAENMALWKFAYQEAGGIEAGEALGFAIETALKRFDTVTSLAVFVSDHEQLRPVEEFYGASGNIWKSVYTAFIPRFLWPEKPVVADARRLTVLYFNVEGVSLAATPMGDLLRNFGWIGVPLGMALLGFVLRVFRVAFVDSSRRSTWAMVAYFLLLTNVSYEGLYGTIFPQMVRLVIVLLVGGFLLDFMIKMMMPAFGIASCGYPRK